MIPQAVLTSMGRGRDTGRVYVYKARVITYVMLYVHGGVHGVYVYEREARTLTVFMCMGKRSPPKLYVRAKSSVMVYTSVWG